MDPQKITELANLLRNNGDKILSSEFTLTLSGSLLRALNDSFTLIADSVVSGESNNFEVAKPINHQSPVFRDLQLVHDFVQKTALLRIVHYSVEEYFEGTIDICKFHALKRLEVQKTKIKQVVGIQPLRSQLQHLVCVKSLTSVDDIITRCGGDNSNGFVWNELKIADFSYNNLQTVDTSLEFAQFLQHLNLRHNQLHSVAAIKWLPHLKTLDLSFNCLQCIPQFHLEACKRLQSLNLSNNFVEDLMGIAKLDALTDLDLSDNCLLAHTYLLPLSALVTLKFLNLYGNPLHCHPKHRLAVCQFLHKNASTVQFILDFDPLSKAEKAVTGKHQLWQANVIKRDSSRSPPFSISSGRTTPNSQVTPASSVSSRRSFKLGETTVLDGETPVEVNGAKKRTVKVRQITIEQPAGTMPREDIESENASAEAHNNSLSKSIAEESNNEHLEAKQQVEKLRETYGADWLASSNAETMQIVLGNTQPVNDVELMRSRQLFNDILGEFSASTHVGKAEELKYASVNQPQRTSTPISKPDAGVTTLDVKRSVDNNDSSQYMSMETAVTNNASGDTNDTSYKSATESSQPSSENQTKAPLNPFEEDEENVEEEPIDTHDHLKNVYSSTTEDDEPAVSEPEDDEETYIVYPEGEKEAIFLTLSANYLREKDTFTHQITKTKWSLTILESCERTKSNTLSLNFDTVKKDKKKRVYTVEDDFCQELQELHRKLGNILSKRDLTEMNQTIYRCVECSCKFSQENKNKHQSQAICCPDCQSRFVAEIHDAPKPLSKTASLGDNLSPAFIVDESHFKNLVIEKQITETTKENVEETNSIGKGQTRLTANNTLKNRSLMQSTKSSANSLNGSSSCSKISNSQSSFDSNQSIMGSSTTDRDNELNMCESDVDILSNPSQSSIEVLDHHASRKTSEERRVSQCPSLETIDDRNYMQRFIDREKQSSRQQEASDTNDSAKQTHQSQQTPTKLKHTAAAGHNNLTESSSSGSVCDSVCTTYENRPAQNAEPIVEPTLAAPTNEKTDLVNEQQVNNKIVEQTKTPELKRVDSGISSMFGGLFQSTNKLMSSSKKLIDAEASANIKTGTPLPSANTQTSNCTPYKFNYSDFNDIDHRLKLYFYQSKFEDVDEHFKWIARGRIYNENTHKLSSGILVLSTCKCYLMEAYAPEHDIVEKWLRQVIEVTVDRLESVQLLPWKIGLSFNLRGWGGFLLLLQDILRTDSLLLCFANDNLPSGCQVLYQPSEEIIKRLNSAVPDEKLQMCALLNGCEITFGHAKRSLNFCALLTTDAHLYLTTKNINWLSLSPHQNLEPDVEICVTQLMSNLVDVERLTDNTFVINFLDETQNKTELWQCVFETKENADTCLNAIGQSWEQLFGVPLTNASIE